MPSCLEEAAQRQSPSVLSGQLCPLHPYCAAALGALTARSTRLHPPARTPVCTRPQARQVNRLPSRPARRIPEPVSRHMLPERELQCTIRRNLSTRLPFTELQEQQPAVSRRAIACHRGSINSSARSSLWRHAALEGAITLLARSTGQRRGEWPQ